MLEATPLLVRGTLRWAAKLSRGVGEVPGEPRRRWLGALRGGDRAPAYRQIAVLTPAG